MKDGSSFHSLEDVLLLVSMQFRTGELVLESGNNIGSILFHEGKIFQAHSPYSRAIGDLMVEDGLITEAELLDILKFQKKSAYLPLGKLILQTGKVTIEAIERMVREQIRQSLKEFRTWKDVHFSFINKNIQPPDRIYVLTHEFIAPETLRSAAVFLSMQTP